MWHRFNFSIKTSESVITFEKYYVKLQINLVRNNSKHTSKIFPKRVATSTPFISRYWGSFNLKTSQVNLKSRQYSRSVTKSSVMTFSRCSFTFFLEKKIVEMVYQIDWSLEFTSFQNHAAVLPPFFAVLLFRFAVADLPRDHHHLQIVIINQYLFIRNLKSNKKKEIRFKILHFKES